MSRIRRALTDRDLESVAHMDRIIFPNDHPVELADAAWWLVEDDDECVVGFGGASKQPGYVFLRRAGLLSRVAGLGLHRRLIRVRIRWAHSTGTTQVVTYTAADSLKSANNLIACGFRLYAPHSAYGGKGSLYFRLKLD